MKVSRVASVVLSAAVDLVLVLVLVFVRPRHEDQDQHSEGDRVGVAGAEEGEALREHLDDPE